MMRRRSNKLVWFIGIPVIAFGLAHWGMHYAVKKRLDRAILEASPQASISYRELETDLRGMIDINGLEVIPTGQPESITIDHISLQGPDALQYMLQHNPVSGDPKALPEHLRFRVRGINMDLGGELAHALDQKQYQGKGGDDQERDPCEGGGELSIGLLKALGMEKLEADITGSYRYRKERESLKTEMNFSIKNVKRLGWKRNR